MNNLRSYRSIVGKPWLAALFALPALAGAAPQKATVVPVEAQLYSTMPSTNAHRPEMAMDGNAKTTFRSYYGMEEGDTFLVMLSRAIPVSSIHISTGNDEGDDRLTDAILEATTDGKTYAKIAAFDAQGVADVKLKNRSVLYLRIRMNAGKAASHLELREIAIESTVPIGHVQPGSPRGFVDISQAPDLAAWAAKAEKETESFWPDAAALLYSDGFITPNAVNIIYKTGPGVTDVAATGGGVMTVNSKWCREHPDDTGLTVHEMAHVVQSGGAPGWLIEAVADYIRWVKFQPQDYTARINVKTATPHDPYRTGATFLGWLELHYDRKLVTKLNDDARFGRYRDALFVKYCGKDIDTLWKEFIAAYQADPAHILTAPVPAAMRPRTLPTVTTSSSIELPWSAIGIVADGSKFRGNGGFDDGGAAYSGTLVGRTVNSNGVTFKIGPVGGSNMLTAQGQTLRLDGSHKSLWLLASAIEGSQRDQVITVTYTDGTSQRFDQNFSDWYTPENFPGETRAVRMPYRNLADGSRDPRPFNLYSYGFTLDPTKSLRSVTLPNNPNLRFVAAALGD